MDLARSSPAICFNAWGFRGTRFPSTVGLSTGSTNLASRCVSPPQHSLIATTTTLCRKGINNFARNAKSFHASSMLPFLRVRQGRLDIGNHRLINDETLQFRKVASD